MYVKLTVVEGDAKTPEIRLKIPAVIGRGRGASLQIPHALVSRQHCEILAIDGKLRVRDLGSLNGTLIDGEKITEAELLSGQTLTVGALTFRVEYGAEVHFGETVRTEAKADATMPAIDEKHATPKTDELLVDVQKELEQESASADLQEPDAGLSGEGSGFLDFLAEEPEGEAASAAPLLPPAAGLPPASQAPAPLAAPPMGPTPPPAPMAPMATPVAAPVATPVAAPVATLATGSPTSPGDPADAPPPAADAATAAAKSDDDDDELRAFLRSLGKK